MRPVCRLRMWRRFGSQPTAGLLRYRPESGMTLQRCSLPMPRCGLRGLRTQVVPRFVSFMRPCRRGIPRGCSISTRSAVPATLRTLLVTRRSFLREARRPSSSAELSIFACDRMMALGCLRAIWSRHSRCQRESLHREPAFARAIRNPNSSDRSAPTRGRRYQPCQTNVSGDGRGIRRALQRAL